MTSAAFLQSSALLLFIWVAFRLVPSIPANAKAWIWRLALLKPLLGLLPLAVVTLHVLPAKPVAPKGTDVAHRADRTDKAYRTYTIYSTPEPSPVDWLSLLWAVGAVGVAGVGVVGSVRAAWVVRGARPVTDPALLGDLSELTQRADVGAVRLFSSDRVESAMLVGWLRPAIVLPSGTLDREMRADTRLMLAHEVAHIARHDLLWFGAIWVAQAAFFFNPLVWVAARCSRLDHESATDRYAAELARVPVPTYAGMLLRATVAPRTSLVPGVLPMAESYRTIHRRLEAMKHFDSKPSMWRKWSIGALALCTVGLIPMYQLANAVAPPQQQGIVTPGPGPGTAVKAERPKSVPGKVISKSGVASANAKAKAKTAPKKGNWKLVPAVKAKGSKGGQQDSSAGTPGIAAPGGLPGAGAPGQGAPGGLPGMGVAGGAGAGAGQPGMPGVVSSGQQGRPSPIDLPVRREFTMVADGADPMISCELQSIDAGTALSDLGLFCNKRFIVDEKLKGNLSLSCQNVMLSTTLKAITHQLNATWEIRDGVYYFQAKPKE